MYHTPVLENEVLSILNPRANQNFIDATAGFGGHAKKILNATSPKGKLIAIEKDEDIIPFLEKTLSRFGKRVLVVNDSFENLDKIVTHTNFMKRVHGILFDLGISSWHIDYSQKGFTFQKEQLLDMRFNRSQDLTAMEIVNEWPEKVLEQILREYSQERFASRIARAIIQSRKKERIQTTTQLRKIIEKAVPFTRKKKIHPATKTFQALRIAVNNELKILQEALEKAVNIVTKGGIIAVISFHSGEDRIVKNFFKSMSAKGRVKLLTKKPIRPSEKEVEKNPRARSAKLRSVRII